MHKAAVVANLKCLTYGGTFPEGLRKTTKIPVTVASV
jgi:hypothetical protein